MVKSLHGASETGATEVTSVIEYCGRCDTRLVPNANFCHHCGAQILRPNTKSIEPPPPTEPRTEPSVLDAGHAGIGETAHQETDEQILWSGRPSTRAIFLGFFRGILIGGLGVAAYRWVATRQHWPNELSVELAVGTIVAILFTIRPLLRVASHRYVITLRSIWVEEGALRSSTSRYPLTGWRYIHVRQSLLQRLFGTGDIELEPVNPIEPPLVLQDIQNVQTLARVLDRTIASAGRQAKHRSQHSQHPIAETS